MLLISIFLLVSATLVGILAIATIRIRRRQRELVNKTEAHQLQRRADHLFKIALASQVHTRQNAIAKVLLEEAIRVLGQAAQLDSKLEAIPISLRDCQTLLATTAHDHFSQPSVRDPLLEFPEVELLEAQLHLTEASRLLMSLEKRGLLGYTELKGMLNDLRQAQRALELRVQLRLAASTASAQRGLEQYGDTPITAR